MARHLRRDPHRRAAPGHRADRGRTRAGRRRRVPAAELAGGSRRVLRPCDRRLRARADRAHLRRQGGAVHPRVRAARAPTSRRTRTATSTTSTSSTVHDPTSCPTSGCTSWSAPRSVRRRARTRRVAWDVVDAATPAEGIGAADPDDVCVLAYTSGTTSDPKGVMHTHRTLLAELVHMRSWITPGSPNLMGSPVTHATGMLGAVLAPMEMGQDIHLIDRWDPRARPPGHARRRCRRGHGRLGLPRERPRPPGLHSRARAAHPSRRVGRCAGTRRARGTRGLARHLHRARLRLDRAPLGHGLLLRRSRRQASRHRRPAVAGSGDPAARSTTARPSRRARPARSGRVAPSCASATPIPHSARTRSTATAGTAAATWVCSMPTGSSRSPTG